MQAVLEYIENKKDHATDEIERANIRNPIHLSN